ncbi:MAG: hypothetical protein IAF08_04360 [Rhizobacter sp.]|nr:hypothetical protein [Chlorobiales bacterium]
MNAMRWKLTPLLKGILWSNVVGFVLLIAINTVAGYFSGERGLVITTGYVFVPLIIGIISAYFWSAEDLTVLQGLGRSLLNTLATLTASFVVMGEGIICLLILAAWLAVLVAIGFGIGWVLFKIGKTIFLEIKKRQQLKASVAMFLALVLLVDVLSPRQEERLVSDALVIQASPEEVWKYVVAFPPIESRSAFWLFDLGLPRPVQTTVSGNFKGAERKCIFSTGAVFDEVMTTFEPQKNLIFDIVKQPADPEILGHFDLSRGQFLIQDNGDGTVTLTGNSWYRLHVVPTWYYDLWAERIVREVHLRVMKHIKTLAESGRGVAVK